MDRGASFLLFAFQNFGFEININHILLKMP